MDEPVQFKASDIDLDLSDHAREVILWLVLGWGSMETMVGLFLIRAFRLPSDDGSILIGAMDTKTKLDKLKTLYEHHGMTAEAKSMGDLKAALGIFADARNLIAHGLCAGHYVPMPDHLVFASGKIIKGRKGRLAGKIIPIPHLEQATEFAEAVAEAFSERASKLKARQSARPPKPPSFAMHPRPTPQKSGGGKQGKRRQSSRG